MNTPKHLEVTAQDFELIKKHRKKIDGYSNSDVVELQLLAKKYINPHTTVCGTCTGNLRDIKDELNKFLAQYGETIELHLNPPPLQQVDALLTEPTPLEKAKKETKAYVNQKNKKN